MQVEHVFKSWKTGERETNGAASVRYFSSDNYGDRTVKETRGSGPSAKAVVKTDPCASLDCPRSGPGPVWALFADPGPGPEDQVQSFF